METDLPTTQRLGKKIDQLVVVEVGHNLECLGAVVPFQGMVRAAGQLQHQRLAVDRGLGNLHVASFAMVVDNAPLTTPDRFYGVAIS